MPRVIVIILIFLLAGCTKATMPPVETERLHHAGGHSFTQHYQNSLFEISERGLYSIELVLPSTGLRGGKNALEIIVHNRDDHDVAGATVTVTPWMPLHGHGVASPPAVEEDGNGVYRLPALDLPMDGLWELRVAVTDNNSTADTAEFLVQTGAIPQQVHTLTQKPDSLDLATTRLSEAGAFQVSYAARPSIALNTLLSWDITILDRTGTPVSGAAITVDGGMPEHGHGLPTKPQVTKDLGAGQYLLEGLRFTMPGWWVVNCSIDAAGQEDQVQFNLMVVP